MKKLLIAATITGFFGAGLIFYIMHRMKTNTDLIEVGEEIEP